MLRGSPTTVGPHKYVYLSELTKYLYVETTQASDGWTVAQEFATLYTWWVCKYLFTWL